jgi:hypothetical protein
MISVRPLIIRLLPAAAACFSVAVYRGALGNAKLIEERRRE